MSFIFQSTHGFPPEIRKDIVLWVASRYRDQMKKGSIVYLWLADQDPEIRGIYGWGVIAAEAPVVVKKKYRIEVRYQRLFQKNEKKSHISSVELKKDPVLKYMTILRMAIGTNFLLTDDEDKAIRAIIERKYGQDWLPPCKNGVDKNEP
jgi:hypothetical protein